MTAPLGSLQMAKLAQDLYKMGPAGRRALSKRLKKLGQPMLADARRRASWSTRIPGAITVRPVSNAAGARLGVALRVSAAQAPHARPYEGLGSRSAAGTAYEGWGMVGGGGEGFRHPVFGHQDRWVPQSHRPFAWPAVNAAASSGREEIVAAYEDAARQHGFR